MTTDLPDPHGCPHCGCEKLAKRLGETVCLRCLAPRRHAEPGCPVRNAMRTIDEAYDRLIDQQIRTIDAAHKRLGIAAETVPLLGLAMESVARTDAEMMAGIRGEHVDAKLLAEIQAMQERERGDLFRQVYMGKFVPAESVTAETARERRVHDGGPRITQ